MSTPRDRLIHAAAQAGRGASAGPGRAGLEMTEVRVGSSAGEDDIVRVADGDGR